MDKKNKKDSLGNRMKEYESVSKTRLTRRTPVIIRLDGKAFHTFTKGFQKPFDDLFIKTMQDTMLHLCKNIQNCVFGYTQSDEITLVMVDYKNIGTSSWFDNEIQKIVSTSAAMATAYFNKRFADNFVTLFPDNCDSISQKIIDVYRLRINSANATFDSRCFNVPREEVNNCLVWRQQDAIRNSVQMLGRYKYSDKQLFKKSCETIKEMLCKDYDIKWSELSSVKQRGSCAVRRNFTTIQGDEEIERRLWVIDERIPIFSEQPHYINNLVILDNE